MKMIFKFIIIFFQIKKNADHLQICVTNIKCYSKKRKYLYESKNSLPSSVTCLSDFGYSKIKEFSALAAR